MDRKSIIFFIIVILSFLPLTRPYAATYNATGIWTASSYGNWVNPGNAGCSKDPNKTVTTIMNQAGDTVSFVADGTLATGTVTGNVYTVSSSRASEGGTTSVTYQITLTSATLGTGTTSWTWTDGYDSCNGGGSFSVTKQQDHATYDVTGIWYYSTSGNWADGCSADPSVSGYTAITQNSDTFTYTDLIGIHTGRIANTNYLSSLRYSEDDGHTTKVTHLTMSSNSIGVGTETWTWTDGYSSCNGGSIISLWKQPTDVTYDASGKWTYATASTSGTLTISQNSNELRINGYNGTHSGLVSSENYIAIASYPSNNGTMTESILFSLSSGTTATGAIERYWTNGYSENWSAEVLSLTKISTINTAPGAPILSSPADGVTGIPNTTILQTGTFSDPDSGDLHSQTEWQISTSSDFSSRVLITTSDINLTSLKVPEFTLASGNQYWWRVRFYDNNLKGSNWSSIRSFTVTSTTNDANNNGIPDNSENLLVDLDNDGTSDNNQADIIKSMDTSIGSGQMGASRKDDPNISSIDSINSIDPDSISLVARPSYMPLGLINLGLSVVRPTDTADVKIYFSQAAPDNSNWYMYNSINGWTDYSAKGLATFSQDRKSVTVRLKDWGHGDADGIPNGSIVDPCGFGIASWIKGFVSDLATSQKIITATISFKEQNLNLNTTNDGNFLSMILPGTYSFTVSAPGYASQTFSSIAVSEASIVTNNISLQSTGQPSPLTQTQVSQLYVSIFGRASEGEGNAYWCATQTDMTIAANTMLDTDPAKTYFGSTLNDNQKFIEFIYLNTLGKTYAEDPDGVNYWVNELVHGKSKGQVIATLINAVMDSTYSGSAAQNQFSNKVTVCDYVADKITTAPDVNDLSAFVNFIKDVTHDSSTVTTAKVAVDAF